MAIVRFGERVTLDNGATPVLLDFHETVGAFVEHDQPVPREVFRVVDGRREHVANIGPGRRVWVQAPGFGTARNRFGTKVGMAYGENTAIASDFCFLDRPRRERRVSPAVR